MNKPIQKGIIAVAIVFMITGYLFAFSSIRYHFSIEAPNIQKQCSEVIDININFSRYRPCGYPGCSCKNYIAPASGWGGDYDPCLVCRHSSASH